MRVIILILAISIVLGLLLAWDAMADPNTPISLQPVQVRKLTAEERLALTVNGTALETLLNRYIDNEMPDQINRAKKTLSKQLTITQMQNAIK